jgi:hypothetical protein
MWSKLEVRSEGTSVCRLHQQSELSGAFPLTPDPPTLPHKVGREKI